MLVYRILNLKINDRLLISYTLKNSSKLIAQNTLTAFFLKVLFFQIG